MTGGCVRLSKRHKQQISPIPEPPRSHGARLQLYGFGVALSGIVAFGLFSSTELASLFFEIQARRVVGLKQMDSGWPPKSDLREVPLPSHPIGPE